MALTRNEHEPPWTASAALSGGPADEDEARTPGSKHPREGNIGATQKRGLANLRFIIFLNFPFMKICLLVWVSGLQLSLTTEGD